MTFKRLCVKCKTNVKNANLKKEFDKKRKFLKKTFDKSSAMP